MRNAATAISAISTGFHPGGASRSERPGYRSGVSARRLRPEPVCGAVAILAALAGVAGAVGAEAPRVTIRADVRFDPGTRTREIQLSGAVASGAAGETVGIEAKECGPRHRFYRIVGGTRTVERGLWQLSTERGGVDFIQLPPNAYFRATWRDSVSEPVLVRVPLVVWVTWRPRRRVVDVSVSTHTSGQNVRGRFVELQRQAAGTGDWVRVRRARLAARPQLRGARLFGARFAVPTRGLTLRVFAPAETGAPCFSAAASETWRS
jgi:hypothetical protein